MRIIQLIISFLLMISIQSSIAVETMTKKEFLDLAYKGQLSEVVIKTLWLNEKQQTIIERILGHRYPKLRLRYWYHSEHSQSVWFLDEIGKERPISFAVSIINSRVDLIKVLAFRESRGGEIQMSAFSEQFNNIGIDAESKLDQHIDGITGATMSVTAMKKITRLALVLHDEVTN